MNAQPERREAELKKHIADFLARESDKTSLIGVTNIVLAKDNTRADVFLSVYPDEQEERALTFVNRKKRELHDFLKEKMAINRIPQLTFAIDAGEKNRRRIDELSREDEQLE